MPQVDFDQVLDELDGALSVRVMYAMVRSNLLHGADNKPSMVILTDRALFWGGSEATEGKFHRVPLKGIIKSQKAGKFMWECVKVKHMEIEGEKTVYICPFTGPVAIPRKDVEAMDALISHIKEA
jgi:hypothetical protein